MLCVCACVFLFIVYKQFPKKVGRPYCMQKPVLTGEGIEAFKGNTWSQHVTTEQLPNHCGTRRLNGWSVGSGRKAHDSSCLGRVCISVGQHSLLPCPSLTIPRSLACFLFLFLAHSLSPSLSPVTSLCLSRSITTPSRCHLPHLSLSLSSSPSSLSLLFYILFCLFVCLMSLCCVCAFPAFNFWILHEVGRRFVRCNDCVWLPWQMPVRW